MKKVFEKLALVALLSIAPLSTASAYSLNYDFTDPGDGSVRTTSVTGATVYDFDTIIPTIAGSNVDSSLPNYLITSGSVVSEYAAPAVGASTDTSKYFVVPNEGSTGKATFVFTELYNYLGLFWGSIDTYNSLSFYNNNTLLGTITGTQAAAPGIANGNWTASSTNRYVNIYSGSASEYFNKVEIYSNGVAFELDNLAVAVVPEPTTMLLFGAGLAGLAAVGRRRKAN